MEIHLVDLLDIKKKIWVRLEKNFREFLFQKALMKSKSLRQLSKIINRELGLKSESTIYNWYNGERKNRDCTKIISHGIPLYVLNFLSNFTNISMNEIEKHIDFIKGDKAANRVFNPKFPIPLSEATASVISHTLHDGYLEPKKLRVVYSNKEKENLEHFKESVIKMFNASKVEFGEILDSDGVTRIGAPNIIGCVLVCFGLQAGNKVKNDIRVPQVLLECKDENTVSAFIGTLVADEGYIAILSKQIGGYIGIKLSGLNKDKPSRLLIHDNFLFNILGISTTKPSLDREKVTKTGERRYEWHFEVSGQRNLLNFYEKVKIPLNRKQNLLEIIIQSYKYFQDRVLIKKDIRIELFNKTIKKFGTIKSLSEFLTFLLNRNISEASINDWRKGRYHCPIDVIVCLAKINNLSLDHILKEVKTYKQFYRSIPSKLTNLQNIFLEFWEQI
jgi:hypothetical protein